MVMSAEGKLYFDSEMNRLVARSSLERMSARGTRRHGGECLDVSGDVIAVFFAARESAEHEGRKKKCFSSEG